MSEHNDATEQHIDSNLHTTIRCPFTCSGIKLCKKKNRRLYPLPLGVNWQSILQVNTLNFGFVFTVQQSSANDSVRFKAKLVYKNHYFANTSSFVPSVVTCIYNRQIYSKIFFFLKKGIYKCNKLMLLQCIWMPTWQMRFMYDFFYLNTQILLFGLITTLDLRLLFMNQFSWIFLTN